MTKHARFSPSAAHRWMNCPASIQAEEKMPPQPPSPYAIEGTVAHKLNEIGLQEGIQKIFAVKEIDGLEIPHEMRQHTLDFLTFVMSRLGRAESLHVEEKVKLQVDVYGTADVAIPTSDELDLIDYKYGQGVDVDPTENPQLVIYALGALKKFYKPKQPPKTVNCWIVQPRTSSEPKLWTISRQELKDTWLPAVQKAVKEAKKKDPKYVAGEHCRFCRAKPTCVAFEQYATQEVAEQFDVYEGELVIPEPDSLSITQQVRILEKADLMISWLKSLQQHALIQINAGIKYPGFEVVKGKGKRRWKDERKAIDELSAAGFECSTEGIRTLTDIEKMVGKKQFSEKFSHLIEKPPGQPKLAPANTNQKPAVGVGFDDFVEP